MVKHEVIPPDGCERVGAAVEPANTLHKVLVSLITESADNRVFSVCGHRRGERKEFVCRNSHWVEFGVQNSKGTVVTNGGQHGGAGAEKGAGKVCV